MKKLFIIACAATLWPGIAAAQTLITQVKPEGSKTWGYADLSGNLVIPAQYEKCYRFTSEGYAPVYDTKERQYYFINTKGEKLNTEIKEFKLKDGFGFDLSGFNDGLIPVKQGEKWGYLSSAGKLAIPAKYDEASEFNGGFAVARIDKSFIVLNSKGEETAVDVPGVADVKPFEEQLAPFRASDKKFGFINSAGKVAIPATFESVGYFTNGLAWVKSDDGKVGYINTTGEYVIKPQFDAGKNFDLQSGLARIKSGDKWGYVNKSGETMFVNDTEVWGDFSEGLAEGKKNGKTGFYDSKGKWVIEPKFEGSRDFHNGYAAAKSNGKWGMINKTGEWVIQPKFDGIKDMELAGR